MEVSLFLEFSKDRLCHKIVSGSKNFFYCFAKSSENMMFIRVADDMPTLYNEILGVIFFEIALSSKSLRNLHNG